MNSPATLPPGQFCWVDLVAHDMTAASAFYADLFDWTARTLDTGDGPPYAMFEHDGEVVAGLGQMSDEMRADGVPPTWNSYILVDDVSEVTGQAEALGASVVAPPTQMMDAGWLSFIEDPTGATVALWQANRHGGAERVNRPNSFCWNELATRDLEGAKEFFHDLLGWTYEENPDSPSPYFIIENNGRQNGGILQMTEDWEGIPPHWIAYFAVRDAAETADRLLDLGGTVHHGPFDTPVGPVAVVSDPQGATFHLIQLDGAGL